VAVTFFAPFLEPGYPAAMAHWVSLVVDGLARERLDDISSAMFSQG
jgi:hypothetical protein